MSSIVNSLVDDSLQIALLLFSATIMFFSLKIFGSKESFTQIFKPFCYISTFYVIGALFYLLESFIALASLIVPIIGIWSLIVLVGVINDYANIGNARFIGALILFLIIFFGIFFLLPNNLGIGLL